MRTTIALMMAISGVCFAPALDAQEAKLVGHWEDAVVLTPAEQEVDVVVDFNRADGQVKDQLWFPLTADGAHEISGFTVEGSHVSFSVLDKDGIVSAFDGMLSPDGAGLELSSVYAAQDRQRQRQSVAGAGRGERGRGLTDPLRPKP